MVADGRAGPPAAIQADGAEIHDADADGFARVIDGMDEAFAVPSAPAAANLVGTAGDKDAAALAVQYERFGGLPVEGGRILRTGERRLGALRGRHPSRPPWHAPINAREGIEDFDARRSESAEGPPRFEIFPDIGCKLGAIFDDDAHLFYLRDGFPVHIGGTDVEMAVVEDPDLLVHDTAAAVPGAHLDSVDEYAFGEFIAQPFDSPFC